MKSLKKTLVLLVVLSMILSAVSPVFAFSDVIPEDYAEQANKMGAFGVFAGDADGNFKAEENITRAEMAVIIGKLMGLTANEADANKAYASNFSDVAAGDWYTGWVNLVAGRGIISGFPDGTFRPNEKVTQAQAVTMIVKALGWGVVVDQTGTWPANYITKASELRLFKNAVDTNSELVTRGNVAIYCYNALTAKTWNVAESTGSELTSKESKENTILAKYFSDFTNDNGEMKLVEDVTVTATPISDKDLGVNQIVLSGAYYDDEDENGDPIKVAANIYGEKSQTIAKFLGLKSSVKNRQEKTYGTGNKVTAYVMESACDNLASLKNKKVDVIFGENNEVAYIAVTDDAVDGLFVTAWDADKAEIELNGEVYELDSKAVVSLFGSYVLTNAKSTPVQAITRALTQLGGIANAKKEITRNISASIVLNEDEEIEGIDFVISEDFGKATALGNGLVPVTVDGKATAVGMQEVVVEKITDSGKITTVNNAYTGMKLEDLEDADVRVVKNNEIVSVDDIKEGNVLTLVLEAEIKDVANGTIGDVEIKTIFVSDARVTGTLDKVARNGVLTIDGEEYNRVSALKGNPDGDIKELKASPDLSKDYLAEEVEVYLNFMGEVSVIVSETEAVPATIGIVTKVYAAEEDKDNDDIEYVEVKILSAETGKATKYYIYNEDDEKDFGDKDAATLGLDEGVAVWFSADADNIIEYSEDPDETEIKVVKAGEKYEVDGDKLDVVAIKSGFTADEEKMEISWEETPAGKDAYNVTYVFDDGVTTYYNNHVCADDKCTCEEMEIELITGWSSLVVEDTKTGDGNKVAENQLLVVNDDEVMFFIGDITKYALSTAEYAIVESIESRKEGSKVKTYVTLVGDNTEYELDTENDDIDEGDFVTYKLSDDEITLTEVLDAWTLADKENDDELENMGKDKVKAKKGSFVVDEVDGRRVRFVEYDEEDVIPSLYLVKTSVTVYDLVNGTVEKVDIEDLNEVLVNSNDDKYVTGYASEEDGNIDIIVVF